MKKSVIGNAIIFGLAVAVASGASIVGCGSSNGGSGGSSGQPGHENTGTVGLQLTLPGGETINTISYAISGPNTYTGTENVSGTASTFSFVIPNVAPGSGYTITLTATTVDGTVTCVGTSAAFSVAASQTTDVNVFLACSTTSEAGSVLVNGTPVNCASWNTAVANPASTTTGGTVALMGAATGPSSSAITYLWSAPTGTIANGTTPNATFTCPSTPGNVTITLAVGDGTLPAGAVCPAASSSTKLTVTCGTPVDAGTPDAGSPDTGSPDTGSTADAGPKTPCTVAGQTGCVPCTGNAGGVCSPTEALFVQADIGAGLVSGTSLGATSCYSCLLNAGCLDDTTFGDVGHECADVSSSSPVDAGSSTESSLCLSTISCVLGTACAGPADGAPAGASGISICYCGGANAGSACQTAPTPNGACYNAEVTGLGVSANATVLKDFTDTTRPAGMANQIFACATSNGCGACLSE